MNNWKTCTVADSFVKSKVGRKNQIPARNIAKSGILPVVDQGQEFIAGYCDDESRIIDFDLPFIIFGDHTRCFKYIDFPFVLGADGTKILIPNKKFYHPKFYYFALLALELPSRGYNRHFKLLKEQNIPLPPLTEQKKIAHILSTVQRAIQAQEQIIQTTTELFKTMLHQLMTAQIRVAKEDERNYGENQSVSGWCEKKVKDIGEIVTGRTPSTRREDFYNGDYNLISPADLDKGRYVRTAHRRLTKLGFEQCRALSKDTVLIGCIGNVGKLGMVDNKKSATNQQINALICNSENDPAFIYYCFSENREKLAQRAVKTVVPILNKNNFGNFTLNVPPLPKQKKIAHILSTIQQKTHTAQSKKSKLEELFRTLLHELMTAKIRVNSM